ncbi:MAG: prenyltransferase [Desulfurococcales archaeon]|nr:prenyltransferase [Desulfurococcales archaeon]
MGRLSALWYSFRKCRVPPGDSVDGVTRLIAASRLCVIPMTFYSVSIGAGLAWLLEGKFRLTLYSALLVAFVLTHLLDNLVNDYYDYKSGLDEPSYFRSLYGPHPFIDGIVSRSELKITVLVIGVYDALLAAYLGVRVSPLIPVLAVVGAAVIASYAGLFFDAKRYGLGEVLVAIVWGPVIAGGTYLALTGHHPPLVAILYLPYAAAVSLVLIGKHMDKYVHDKSKGIGTLPVRLGLENSKKLAITLSLLIPVTSFLAFYYTTRSLLSVLLLLPLLTASTVSYTVFSKDKPEKPPKNWDVWPLWYVAASYAVMDSVGRTTLLSIIILGLYMKGASIVTLALVGIITAWEIFSASLLYRITQYN